jgi:hypothetical protein
MPASPRALASRAEGSACPDPIGAGVAFEPVDFALASINAGSVCAPLMLEKLGILQITEAAFADECSIGGNPPNPFGRPFGRPKPCRPPFLLHSSNIKLKHYLGYIVFQKINRTYNTSRQSPSLEVPSAAEDGMPLPHLPGSDMIFIGARDLFSLSSHRSTFLRFFFSSRFLDS